MRAGTETRQEGQALVELLIVSALVLLPLLLMLNVLASYTDIRHATVQAARYQAWEYTALKWTDSGPIPRFHRGARTSSNSGLPSPPRLASRSSRAVADLGRRHFFSDCRGDLSDPCAGASPPTLWWYGPERRYLASATEVNAGDFDSFTTFSGGFSGLAIMQGILDALDFVRNFIAGPAQTWFETVDAFGPMRAEVELNVTYPRALEPRVTGGLLGPLDPTQSRAPRVVPVRARSALLVDAWDSSGTTYTEDEAADLVLTDLLLDNPVVKGFTTVVSAILFSPEVDRIDPGYVDVDAVPKSALHAAGSNTTAFPDWPNCGTDADKNDEALGLCR